MDLKLNFHELIILIGLFLSFIMAIVFSIKSKKQFANIWFSGFLTVSSIVFIVKLLYSTGHIVNYPHWFKLNYPAGILRPVFFYFYIAFLLDNRSKFMLKHLLHFIPFAILSFYLMPFFLTDAVYKTDVLYGNVVNHLGIIPDWFVIFQFLYSIAYLTLTFLSLKSYRKKNPRPNRDKRVLMNWVRLMLTVSAVFILGAFLIRVTGLNEPFNIYSYDLFSILLIILSIRLMTLSKIVGANAINKYEHSSLSEKDVINLFAQMNTLMNVKNYYKNRDLKITNFAQSLELPVYQVSQIINESTGKSFTDFVNEYRVKEAKRILSNNYSKYTIEGIGHEAGFKSRSSFYNAFKKHTGLTPSQYLQ